MKKMFLSLATIAFVATGALTVTSCGSDDSTPNPNPNPEPERLTENFIEVDGEQEEIVYSIYAVHVSGSGAEAPIREYALEDGRKVIVFEFVVHNGTGAGAIGSASADTWATFYTLVDESIEVGGEGRYVLPFVEEGRTLSGGYSTAMNDTTYTFANGATFNLTELVYGEGGSMIYTLEGVDVDASSVELKTNVNTGFTGALWSLPTNTGKGLSNDFSIKRSVQLTERAAL